MCQLLLCIFCCYRKIKVQAETKNTIKMNGKDKSSIKRKLDTENRSSVNAKRSKLSKPKRDACFATKNSLGRFVRTHAAVETVSEINNTRTMAKSILDDTVGVSTGCGQDNSFLRTKFGQNQSKLYISPSDVVTKKKVRCTFPEISTDKKFTIICGSSRLASQSGLYDVIRKTSEDPVVPAATNHACIQKNETLKECASACADDAFPHVDDNDAPDTSQIRNTSIVESSENCDKQIFSPPAVGTHFKPVSESTNDAFDFSPVSASALRSNQSGTYGLWFNIRTCTCHSSIYAIYALLFSVEQ